jgi:long-chain acyl-CoA synthetase
MIDTAASLLALVAKVAKRDPEGISLSLRLAEDLGVKSIGRVELAALIEDQLGVSINNFEIRRPKTIGDVVALVDSKR